MMKNILIYTMLFYCFACNQNAGKINTEKNEVATIKIKDTIPSILIDSIGEEMLPKEIIFEGKKFCRNQYT